MTIEQAKIIGGGKCGDNNRLGCYALKCEIEILEDRYSICNELSDDLKIKGLEYLLWRIAKLHDENKYLLDFDKNIEFTDEEIEDQICDCGCLYLDHFREYGTHDFRYDEEGECFVNDDGRFVSDEEVLESEYCEELAVNDLWETYRREHPNGAYIDDLINEVNAHSGQKQLSLVDFIIKDREKSLDFISSELNVCRSRQCKLIAMIIIVLHEAGNLVQYNGKLKNIHKALQDAHPGKIGTLTGIVDYLNSYKNPDYCGDKYINPQELELLRNKLK